MLRKRFGALAMAACLLVALTCGAGVALAAGSNTLTVTGENSDTLMTELQSGKVSLVVDVYKIADATYNSESDSYKYKLVKAFKGLKLKKALKGKYEWSNIATDAWDIAAGSSVEPVDSRTTSGSSASFSGLEDGVYLVLAHGKNAPKDELTAKSQKYEYEFLPSVISLPSKYSKFLEEGDSGNKPQAVIDSAYPGEWQADVTISIKPKLTPVKPDTPSKSKSTSKPKPSTKSSRTPVKTGDDTNIIPFIVAMGVSGALLIGLGVYNVRSRRREKEETRK